MKTAFIFLNYLALVLALFNLYQLYRNRKHGKRAFTKGFETGYEFGELAARAQTIAYIVRETMHWPKEKSNAWFLESNPLLGNQSPTEMIAKGRYMKLLAFVLEAYEAEKYREHAPSVSKT